MSLIDKPVDYSLVKSACKSGQHGVAGLLAYGVARAVQGYTSAPIEPLTLLVFLGLEILRNALKQKKPSIFFWL